MTIENYTELQARVAELEAIEKQLSDNVIWQAGEIARHLTTIEASRKQEAVAWTTPKELDFLKDSNRSSAMLFNFTEPDQKFIALYAAPVVAPDVLKDAERYRWIRDRFYADWVEVYGEKRSNEREMECSYARTGIGLAPIYGRIGMNRPIITGYMADAAIDKAMGGANG